MHLAPRERDKLLLAQVGLLAQRRLARGLRLNQPEAVGLVALVILELIRDGRHSVAQLMNLGRTFKPKATHGVDADANIERIQALWAEARKHFGKSGPFLYGTFSAADAMFAPVVTRFDSYQFRVTLETRKYMDAVLHHPAFVDWRLAALKEPWFLADYEKGHEIATSHITPKA